MVDSIGLSIVFGQASLVLMGVGVTLCGLGVLHAFTASRPTQKIAEWVEEQVDQHFAKEQHIEAVVDRVLREHKLINEADNTVRPTKETPSEGCGACYSPLDCRCG